MVLSNEDRERILRRIKIIEIAIEEAREIVGTEWFSIVSTSDGYLRVCMYDGDESITKEWQALRLSRESDISLSEVKE